MFLGGIEKQHRAVMGINMAKLTSVAQVIEQRSGWAFEALGQIFESIWETGKFRQSVNWSATCVKPFLRNVLFL